MQRSFFRRAEILCLLLGSLPGSQATAQTASSSLSLKEVSPGRYCSRVGIATGTDVLNGSLLLKRDDNCRIETIPFSASTRFLTRSGAGILQTIDPHAINIGDRLCVQFEGNETSAASAILVLSRTDMQQQQLHVLATLHRDSAFGTITKLDAATRCIEVNRVSKDGSLHALRVDAEEPVAIRRYGEDAIALDDAEAGSWEELSVGSKVYIRGQSSADRTSMRAGLIVLGGFRTFVGRVRSIDALTETVEVADVHSEKVLTVHVHPAGLFRISPFQPKQVPESAAGGNEWTLHSLNFGDLHQDDVVAVLGKVSECAPQVQGLAVFEVYGSFDLVPRSPAGQTLWMLDPLNLDVR